MAEKELKIKKGRPPTITELAEKLNLSEDQVHELKLLDILSITPFSDYSDLKLKVSDSINGLQYDKLELLELYRLVQEILSAFRLHAEGHPRKIRNLTAFELYRIKGAQETEIIAWLAEQGYGVSYIRVLQIAKEVADQIREELKTEHGITSFAQP
jgi:DNA-directed RNA polymerase specialized sigma subunit